MGPVKLRINSGASQSAEYAPDGGLVFMKVAVICSNEKVGKLVVKEGE